MAPKKIASTTALMLAGIFACTPKQENIVISVENRLPIERSNETVEVPLRQVYDLQTDFTTENIVLAYRETGTLLPFQIIDRDGNGSDDIIIFQPKVPPQSKQDIRIQKRTGDDALPTTDFAAFSRFVPERIDDYAWENDRVAFRTYGPEAQRLTEAGDPGGTLSSGIDCWLKRVQYPIINIWYKKAFDGTGSYHEDTGEGLDNYHVGPSRGCGGTGIWVDQVLYTSNNFTAWERISAGPIRTSFILTYGPWKAPGHTIHEKKHISLDLGSNLSRIEMHIESDPPVDEVTIGIAIHDKKGTSGVSEEEGWFNFWQPHGDSYLGTAVVIDPSSVTGHTEYRTDEKDKSHLYVHAKPTDGTLVYYTGFFWQRSGQFEGNEAWQAYLRDFARKLSSPIAVHLQVE